MSCSSLIKSVKGAFRCLSTCCSDNEKQEIITEVGNISIVEIPVFIDRLIISEGLPPIPIKSIVKIPITVIKTRDI